MLAAFALLLAATSARADAFVPSVRLHLAPPSPQQEGSSAPNVVISGQAPRNCVPRVASSRLDGSDFSIVLDMPRGRCDPGQRLPYRITASPPQGPAGLSARPPVYRIRVYAKLANGTHLLAFRLFDPRPEQGAIRPENGFWWSQASPGELASPGTGVSLEWQDGQLAASLFGFTPGGTPTWAFGSAQLAGRVARLALVELAGGDPPFSPAGSQPRAAPAPRLEIEFTSPITARAWLVRDDGTRDVEVRALQLARSRFADAPAGAGWSGRWLWVTDDGPGPQAFEFEESANNPVDTFRLVDGATDASLECRLAPAAAVPELCTLTVAGGPSADFDRIGFERLEGRDEAGRPTLLLRVSR